MNEQLESKNYIKPKKHWNKTPLVLVIAVVFLLSTVLLSLNGFGMRDEGQKQTSGTAINSPSGSSAVHNGNIEGISFPDLNEPGAGQAPRQGFADVDFRGHTFTFAAPINEVDGWPAYEVYADEDSESIFDDAITQRNDILADNYNCFIEVESSDLGTLTNDFATNQNRIDLVLYKYNMNSKANGNFHNLFSLDIDFKMPWWDQNFISDNTVNGQIYAMLGAFSLTSLDTTWVMYFNKAVLEKSSFLNNVDLYDLVYNNEWTLDTFFDIIRRAAYDSGDGQMTLGTDDVFGYLSSSFGIRGLYFGANQSYLVTMTNNMGNTYFSSGLDKTAEEVTDKIIEIYQSPAVAITNYGTVELQMRSNNVLFVSEVLGKAPYYMGKMGDSTEAIEFGILPHPKFMVEQAQYKHFVEIHSIYLCVPKTTTNVERIANFLELYAYHSYYTVYKEYLNLFSSDSDMKNMIDIILDTRSFDMAYHYSWGRVDADYLAGVADGENIVKTMSESHSVQLIAAANSYRDNLPEN